MMIKKESDPEKDILEFFEGVFRIFPRPLFEMPVFYNITENTVKNAATITDGAVVGKWRDY